MTTVGGETAQLALAAASTASTAAAAATAAAAVLVDSSVQGLNDTSHKALTEAHDMLEAHERLILAASAPHDADQLLRQANESSHHAMMEGHKQIERLEDQLAVRKVLLQATAAAAAASAEAAVATHAAGTVCDLPIVTGTSTMATTVASNLVAASHAVTQYDGADAQGSGLRVAANAIDAIGVAQERLMNVQERLADSEYVADVGRLMGGGSHAQTHALSATQRAAMGVADAAAAAASRAREREGIKERALFECAGASSGCVETASETRSFGCVEVISDTGCKPTSKLDALIRDGADRLLWCWLPRSNRWTEHELLERSTRAVAACRAHDVIALPDLPPAHELIEHWTQFDYGDDCLRPQNVIWFDSLLTTLHMGDESTDATETKKDPAFVTLVRILEVYRAQYSVEEGGKVALYHMYPDERTCRLAASYGLLSCGDLDSHPIVGSLRQAKS